MAEKINNFYKSGYMQNLHTKFFSYPNKTIFFLKSPIYTQIPAGVFVSYLIMIQIPFRKYFKKSSNSPKILYFNHSINSNSVHIVNCKHHVKDLHDSALYCAPSKVKDIYPE